MQGIIRKIDPPKAAKYGNRYFIRVHIELESGDWAMTDLVPSFRNYKRWEPIMKVGNTIDGIRLIGKAKVDADSEVKKINIL